MNLLFDTNIILSIVRSNDSRGLIRLLNPHSSSIFISIASLAETKSIARQKRWGLNKQKRLNDFIDQVNTIDIDNLSMDTYAEIDSFYQLQNPDFPKYSFQTPRNMGKNDLWIASLASILGLQLITTDADFDHLNGIFFEVRKIDQLEFLPFLKK